MTLAKRLVYDYVVEEVFPWGGKAVFFFKSVRQLSRTGVPLSEIGISLDSGYLDKLYGALMYPKKRKHGDVTTPVSKCSKLP